ncbi:Non-specific lipid-transfer protein 4 [Acorus calamus]|uniref:Non-specific lipid-transfer protein n=1 Tax=Acorus calamus TaxID=4465 RepID=A0AAV9C5R9_ACOCL|nr:Non-specific lipid-transfer protein 4 [Acorus calamus]
MASTTFHNVAFALLVALALLAIGPPPQRVEAALSCGTVYSDLSMCLPYLSSGGVVPQPCCDGVRSLNAAARTTPDRQQACACLKQAAASIPPQGLQYASSLPGKCGVTTPYPISPSTDCSKVK